MWYNLTMNNLYPTGSHARSSESETRTESIITLAHKYGINTCFHELKIELDTIKAILEALGVGVNEELKNLSNFKLEPFLDSKTPKPLKLPDLLDDADSIWGVNAQLYAVLSQKSWGIGDFHDLRDLLLGSHKLGADFVLVNPLNASEMGAKMEDSPYFPRTKFFLNPIYIRPEDTREYALLNDDERKIIGFLSKNARNHTLKSKIIDRNYIWAHKSVAFDVLFNAITRDEKRIAELDKFVNKAGVKLTQFVKWNLWHIREHSGVPKKKRFYEWLQFVCYEQLKSARIAAKSAGMKIGLIGDLPVGTAPNNADIDISLAISDANADSATLDTEMHEIESEFDAISRHKPSASSGSNDKIKQIGLVTEAFIGAPPDRHNAAGQNWKQMPPNPLVYEQNDYAFFRELVAQVFNTVDAIRIDHMLGMFRLWLIPRGNDARAGTYVDYNYVKLINIIISEAVKVGAIVIGEDLGVPEEGVAEYLSRTGVLGVQVLQHLFDTGQEVPHVSELRKNALTSLTTHDDRPTAGYLLNIGSHVNAPNSLTEQYILKFLSYLEKHGYITSTLINTYRTEDDESRAKLKEIMLAMHKFLRNTPAKLKAVSFSDFTLETRRQNAPGTYKEYPNWRLPVSDINGKIVFLEDILALDFTKQIAEVMNFVDKEGCLNDK